jgi:hypothetical protein
MATLIKTDSYYYPHVNDSLATLNKMHEQLSTMKIVEDYELPSTISTYAKSSAASTVDAYQQTSNDGNEILDIQSTTNKSEQEDEDLETVQTDDSYPDENYFANRERFEITSYIVDCMASDGVNIMYTSTNDKQCPIIAYCYLDPDDVDYRKADRDREWRQSRIVDLIWWDSIDHFVCATKNGFYTIEFIDPRFRILCPINTRCENPCIAAHSDQ